MVGIGVVVVGSSVVLTVVVVVGDIVVVSPAVVVSTVTCENVPETLKKPITIILRLFLRFQLQLSRYQPNTDN